MLPEFFDLWQETLDWQPTAQQQDLFQQLYTQILQGNQSLNLTRITAPQDFWEKHLWDSLNGIGFGLNIDEFPAQIIDIGTGAGFPGLPVAIVKPQSTVTLLDSTRKKITFLEQLTTTLNLKNTQTLVGRAEAVHLQPQYEQYFDVALVRAVGSAAVCTQYALPFLKLGGRAILYRGNWTVEETQDLERVLQKLGGKLESIVASKTPLTQGIRHAITLKKV